MELLLFYNFCIGIFIDRKCQLLSLQSHNKNHWLDTENRHIWIWK